MIKRMALYSIPLETNGDEFWQYHTREHAPAAIQTCGDNLVKYKLNRVIRQTKGSTKCFGVVETWWRDTDAMAAGFKALDTFVLESGKSVAQDYFDRLADKNIAFEVEEFVVKQTAAVFRKTPFKYMGFYSIPEETDPDEFWEYHTSEHAAHSVDSFGSYLDNYVINRVTRVVKGQLVCFGVVELWFADSENFEKGFEAHKAMMLPNGRNVSEDFDVRVVDAFGYVVEEFEAKTDSGSQ